MSDERRRYFRIDDTLGISYSVIDGERIASEKTKKTSDVMSLVSEQDQRIQHLLVEVANDNPKVAELITVFNQKIERIVNQLLLENHMVGRIAYRVKEANISACGIGFANDEAVSIGTRLSLEVSLFPGEKVITTNGIVVACDELGGSTWYWRIDFYGMSDNHQEVLIQHIVQAQSAQIKRFT